MFFYFHPYLGKIPILTNIVQRGWNHQLEKIAQKQPEPQPAPKFARVEPTLKMVASTEKLLEEEAGWPSSLWGFDSGRL